ncbi:MAG: hypothetical protein QOE45_1097 [Frankiaceae bacterium]|jgi:asparagine synthase (glutamine-hydrolysing)|nr:hypothetical protein [Frankiaceae bacterium]
MCGIAGTAGVRPAAERRTDALAALVRRGPDGSFCHSARVGERDFDLLHTRLAINDMSPAAVQPMSDESERFVMVFNGEIYNYRDLRAECEARGHAFKSAMDGEVILHLFQDHGPAAFDRLNGIFSIGILDSVSGEVFLARDPLGVKPLFYARDAGGGLRFASELDALAELGADLGSYDTVAMAQFLTFLWVPSPRTPFSGAASLPPGHYLRWHDGTTETRRYCAPLHPAPGQRATDAAATVAEGRALFHAAAQRQLLSDVPVGLMASGGIDSGLLWWATHESLDRAFTIAWPGGSEGLDHDVAGVRRLQSLYGTKVVEIEGGETGLEGLPLAGDLFADPAFSLTRVIATEARAAGVPVLLSGQGGDELFGGYRRHRVAAMIERFHIGRAGGWAHRGLRRLSYRSTSTEYAARLALALGEKDPFRGYMQLATYSTAADRAEALDCTTAEVSDDVVWQEHQAAYDALPSGVPFARKAMALDLNVYLPGLGLAYVDRAGMEHGVEIRVPWLDLELVRWSLDVPLDLLLRERQGKWLTRRIAEGTLPPATVAAPKQSFGAPATHLSRDAGSGTGRGFRQDVYFNRAKRLLQEYRTTVGKSLLGKAG